jgi:hypothetical protein
MFIRLKLSEHLRQFHAMKRLVGDSL